MNIYRFIFQILNTYFNSDDVWYIPRRQSSYGIFLCSQVSWEIKLRISYYGRYLSKKNRIVNKNIRRSFLPKYHL
uniref:Uncharacterized protein n=1 Tax=Octopus bimaculoides TaxID=37653 RepID=A0A0L8GZQ7_OCTBM